MKHRGFTLIELMILLAIIGILLAIAVPALSKKAGNQNDPHQPTHYQDTK